MSVNEPMPVFDLELQSNSMVDLTHPGDSTEGTEEIKTASAHSASVSDNVQPRGLSGRYALMMNILMLERA